MDLNKLSTKIGEKLAPARNVLKKYPCNCYSLGEHCSAHRAASKDLPAIWRSIVRSLTIIDRRTREELPPPVTSVGHSLRPVDDPTDSWKAYELFLRNQIGRESSSSGFAACQGPSKYTTVKVTVDSEARSVETEKKEIQSENLQDWLDSVKWDVSSGLPIREGSHVTHLLIHNWDGWNSRELAPGSVEKTQAPRSRDPQDREDKQQHIPFADLTTFDAVVETLGLPRSYPWVFASKHSHLPFPQAVSDVSSNRSTLQYHCQLPSLHLPGVDTGPGIQPQFLWSLGGCYFPSSHVTTGFLTLPNEAILPDRIKEMAQYSSHPMFLLIMFYDNIIFCLNKTIRRCYERYREIQIFERKMASVYGSMSGPSSFQNDVEIFQFDQCMKKMMEVHVMINDIQWDFVKELQEALSASMKSFTKIDGSTSARELHTFFSITKESHRSLLFERTKYTTWASSQQQAFYNRMHSRNSSLAQRDSSQMKVISILTILFLPATAIAGFFNMEPFFLSSTDGGISISSDIWIFGALSASVTFIVLLVYAARTQRGR